MTKSFISVLITICFALSAVAQPIAQEATTQHVSSLAPAAHSRSNASSESRDLESSRLDTSPDKELKPQMNQSLQGRRKGWAQLIPLMALGALVLFLYLIAPST